MAILRVPENHALEECPQCGVFVSKFKEQQKIKERNEQAQRRQEETTKARRLESEQWRAESARRAMLTLSALKRIAARTVD